MTELYSTSIIRNIYKRPSTNSEVSSQIIYGEKVRVLGTKNKWIKIRTLSDNYSGYIKKEKLKRKLKIIFKTSKLKTRIFSQNKTKDFLTFNSRLPVLSKRKNFIEFEKNKWIKKNNLRKINYFEKNYNKIFKFFLNSKYLWGGKTSDGIDCSALVQIYFYYNRIFFPRDTKDQIRFCKIKNKKIFSKGDIIFWKGHVGVCLNQIKFIHAYGPKKKVIIMPTNLTIQHIKKTAKLIVKKVSNIGAY